MSNYLFIGGTAAGRYLDVNDGASFWDVIPAPAAPQSFTDNGANMPAIHPVLTVERYRRCVLADQVGRIVVYVSMNVAECDVLLFILQEYARAKR